MRLLVVKLNPIVFNTTGTIFDEENPNFEQSISLRGHPSKIAAAALENQINQIVLCGNLTYITRLKNFLDQELASKNIKVIIQEGK